MFSGYDPELLLAQWNKGKLTLEEAFKRMIENQVRYHRHQRLNDNDIIMQQQEIEKFHLIIPKLEDRIKVLEQKPDIDDSNNKENGKME